MTLCVIPARGGSKSIPHKNIVPVGGKPLIVWSIEQAFAAELVSRVIVATDAVDIAEVAVAAGADIFWRSAFTATDLASTESAVLECLQSLTSADLPELTLLLQATSPIRQPQDIDNAIRLLEREQASSLFSARRIVGYCWHETPLMYPQLVNGPRRPRQIERDVWWEENGSLYVFRTREFLNSCLRLFGKQVIYEMHPLDSFQIDEPADLPLVEHLIPLRMPHAGTVANAN